MQSSDSIAGSERALHGIRVLDFTIMVAGPYCSRLLADLGADVVKIEPPEGDDMRLRQPLREAADGTRHSSYFGQLNAGKRSLALDLKHPEAIALVKRMAAQADVVIENFRPGVMQRLGLGAAVLREINPRLIFCSVSGYGQSGPAAGRAAYAMLVQAASGYEGTLARYAGDRSRPAPTATFVADVLGGIYAFGAIQTALVQRTRTSQGQALDVALMDSMLNLLIYEMQEAQFPVLGARPTYGPVATMDGDVLIAPITERNFQALATVTGLPQWKSDPRFATLPQRAANWQAMMQVLEPWTRARPKAEVLAKLESAGVPCAPYGETVGAFDDPQLQERGVFAQVHDAAGPFIGINAPWQMSAGGSAMGARVPEVGEHADEVLRDWLGMEPEAVRQLREQRAVGR